MTVPRINWWQALAEVLLLLIGIGAALAVDSWREEASDRAAEQAHLRALKADFEATDSLVRFTIAGLDDQLIHNERLLEILAEGPSAISTDTLASMLRKAFIGWRFDAEMSAYDDLTNSGELTLIRSGALRRSLARFENAIASANYSEALAGDQWSASVTQFFIEELNATAIYGRDSGVQWGSIYLPPYDRTPLVLLQTVEPSAVWSQELANHVAVRNVTLDDSIRLGQASLNVIGEVLLLIDQALEPGTDGS